MGEEEKKVETKTTEEKVEQPVVDVGAKVQEGIDAARQKDEEKKAHDHLGFLKRTNPEAYKNVMEKQGAGSDGNNEDLKAALDKIDKLELDRAREKSLRRYGLDDEDERFLFGKTPEEIEEQAKALSERYDGIRPKGKDGKPVKPEKSEPEDEKAGLRKYDKSSGKTEIEFHEENLEQIARENS